MTIERVWAMPNRWTFTIPPIARLLKEEIGQGIWADPFAGNNSPAALTNDINPLAKANSHQDALDFLRSIPDHSVEGVLFDPPYSFRQASECCKMAGLQAAKVTSKKYWAECKTEVARIIRPNGKAICFGWTSMGMGNTRKKDGLRGDCFADCELAWTSFDRPSMVFNSRWSGFLRDSKERRYAHPTQKALDVMKWCVLEFSNPGETILDPFCGTGTSLVAAAMLSRRYFGIDRDEEYLNMAHERLHDSLSTSAA